MPNMRIGLHENVWTLPEAVPGEEGQEAQGGEGEGGKARG